MARLGVSKKKKNPRATELSQLKKEVQRLTEQLESRDREQTATSEILRLIATLSMDIQSVLDTIAENAARVCGSYDAVIRLVEGNILRMAAHHGPTESGFGLEQPLTRGTIGGRAVIDRQTIHIHDLLAESETEFAASIKNAQRLGHRTFLATPLLREGSPIGVILVRRKEVHPFTESRSLSSKLSLTRPSSPSRTCGCSRRSRSVTQNCAKRWSIKPQRLRCSALLAARRRTCSRSSMLSSRAPPEFVELMI